MLRTGCHGIFQSLLAIRHLVVFLQARLQAGDYLYRLLNRRLLDVDGLETARHGTVLEHLAVVFLMRGGTHEAYCAALKIRLEDVGSVGTTVAASAGADDVVYLVEIEYGFLLARTVEYQFQTLFEVASELCSGEQLSHVHAVYSGTLQPVGHLSLVYQVCQSVYQCRLAHAGVAHVQRVVLLHPAYHLYRPVQLLLSAYQRRVGLGNFRNVGHKTLPVFRTCERHRLAVVVKHIIVVVEVIIVEVGGVVFIFQKLRICFGEIFHEFALMVFYCGVKYIGSHRVLQIGECHNVFSHAGEFFLESLGYGACVLYQVSKLCRRNGHLVFAKLLVLVFEIFCESCMQLVVVHSALLKSQLERLLLYQSHQQMLRHYVFVCHADGNVQCRLHRFVYAM